MSMRLSKEAYMRLIEEDLAWLLAQPSTCESRHIEAIVKRSFDHEYRGEDPNADSISVKASDLNDLLNERNLLRSNLTACQKLNDQQIETIRGLRALLEGSVGT